ncbi:MAG: phospho-sugar mutase [Defluviitaleaceae bacterium]|nr:phospho-sugar mutase [Defluviitaleaceae bacterium]
MDYKQAYNNWLSDPYIDADTKAELAAIANDEREIEDRFHQTLEFGTGGLRGIMAAGTNRMNLYTLRSATQGLANYILQEGGDLAKRGVVIAHDSRRNSAVFAKETALVLNGNGIKTFVFDGMRPTPMLSFAVRYLGCAAGIVITASHNPKEYNGYKVFWSDGAQVPYPQDEAIIAEVLKITNFDQIKIADENEARKAGLYNVCGPDIDDEFIRRVMSTSQNSSYAQQHGDICIVYSPFNGAGGIFVKRALREAGFTNVHIVKEQEQPDPNFTTIGYPNPEDPAAWTLPLELARKECADIVLATDPDGDRLGVQAKNSGGGYTLLSGNQVGALIAEYIVTEKQRQGTLPKHGAIISTIVSSRLTKEIAERANVGYFETLTGFKHIGGKIRELELANAKTPYEFLFGFEESIGYLAGTHGRDKDAIVAALLVCEIAAAYKARGMTLLDGITEIYEKYGYFKEHTVSLSFQGIEGSRKISRMMEHFRNSPPKEIAGQQVLAISDILTDERTDLTTGTRTSTGLPRSNVLLYELADNGRVAVRPSGTEPKIKFYFGVKGATQQEADAKVNRLSEIILAQADSIE